MLFKISLSAVALFIILIFQEAYETSLFNESLTLLPVLQEGSSNFTQKMWLSFSDVGNDLIIFAPIALTYFFFNQRARCFYYIFLVQMIQGTGSIAKIHFHQARPFWVNPAIKAINCSKGYGNPSSHSYACMGISLAIFLDFNAWVSTRPDSKMRAWYWQALLLIVSLIFTGAICYSRLFLGVHSLNQVILGLKLGIWFALTSHFIVREPMTELIENIMRSKYKGLYSLALQAGVLLVSAITLTIINYEVVREFPNPAEWSTNIVAQCGEKAVKFSPQAKMLFEFGQFSIVCGAFYGILAHQRYFPGLSKAQLLNDTWTKMIARYLVGCVVAAPWSYVNSMIGVATLESSIALMVFHLLVPALLLGFCLFFVADWINERFGLLQVADVNAEQIKKDDETPGATDEDSKLLDRSGNPKEE